MFTRAVVPCPTVPVLLPSPCEGGSARCYDSVTWGNLRHAPGKCGEALRPHVPPHEYREPGTASKSEAQATTTEAAAGSPSAQQAAGEQKPTQTAEAEPQARTEDNTEEKRE
jgi:hypothetical protein